MTMPQNPKIYHIVHVDRLYNIVKTGFLYSYGIIKNQHTSGTSIGIEKIKERRLIKSLGTYENLHVGDCVPFYFCPRSVMLYIIKSKHPSIEYLGGQADIVHLEADLYKTIKWTNIQNKRWVFTDRNAGSFYFQDFSDIKDLNKLNWNAINARYWSDEKIKEGKQAEFLVENCFPWHLVERIGVISDTMVSQTQSAISTSLHQPSVHKISSWYY